MKVLTAALRWAALEGHLDRSPLEGLRIAGETDPKRPVLSRSDYLALLEVADCVHPYCRPLLVLARETGHRLGAILALRWSDVNLSKRTATWRAASDKKRREHETPLTDAAVAALDARAAGVLADGQTPEGYIFAASNGGPVRSDTATAWWLRAETAAKLTHVAGRGWHSIRRAFASDLAPHVSLAALKALGGWQDVATLTKCYVLTDAEGLRPALERRA